MDPSLSDSPHVAVLMTTHDRPMLLSSCLDSLNVQVEAPNLTLFITLDGNVASNESVVRQHFPRVEFVKGDGTLFWARGMALAEAKAMSSDPDYYLWLNEDVILDPDAIAVLLAVSKDNPDAIVVGSTRDPESKEFTYGVRKRVTRNPQRFVLLPPTDELQNGDTFHGNVVLIPKRAHNEVGCIDGVFAHGYADDDYGLRAKNADVQIVQASASIGECSRLTTSRAAPESILARFRQMNHPLGRPLRSQFRYLRRHGGVCWPYWFVRNQVGFLFGSLKAKRARRR